MGYGLGTRRRRRRSPPATRREARDRDDGRRRLLAQRPDQRRRQRGLQPQRQPDHRRRQQLHLGDRRPGPALVEARRTRRAAPATRSSARCAASASSGCGRSGAPTTSPAMRDALREALTTTEKGPKVLIAQSECQLNRQRREQAAGQEGDRGRRARRARALRRRRRHLHRRPFVHPPLGLPVAVDQAEPRPAAHRPGRDRARQLRRLRRLRRGLARGRALPVVLQGADRQQPERLGPLRRARPRRGDRLAAAARRSAPARASRSRTANAWSRQPIKIAIMAMGGEGGGVLADWIVDLGEANGHLAQTHLGARRRPAHRRDDLLRRAFPARAGRARRRRAGARADAAAGRRRRRPRVGADGGRPRRPARPRHAGPHDADRVDAPRLLDRREDRARRRPRRQRRAARACRARGASASSASTWPRPPSRPAA